MKAQNLTVSVPYEGCDKKCPYCVSQITGLTDSNFRLMTQNAKKVRNFATAANVTNVLITGKGEPLLNHHELQDMMIWFVDFPLELQTNGLKLFDNPNWWLTFLANEGLNVLAISIDHISDFAKFGNVARLAKYDYHMLVRFTFNVTNKMSADPDNLHFGDLIRQAKNEHAHQLSLRNIVVPANTMPCKASKWIKRNVNPEHYKRLKGELEEAVTSGNLIRTIQFDDEEVKVYDLQGVSVTTFNYCIQDSNHGDDIRSLIFQEDGHLYTSWNSQASALF